MKEGEQKSRTAVVVDPMWSGRVKVRTEHDMQTRSYMANDLVLINGPGR